MGTERGSVLLEAHKVINGDRQQSYGNPEDTHAVIADMWNGYLQGLARTCDDGDFYPLSFPHLTNADVAYMMVLFKIARQINGAGKRDNAIDGCGYLALAWDMYEEKERQGEEGKDAVLVAGGTGKANG